MSIITTKYYKCSILLLTIIFFISYNCHLNTYCIIDNITACSFILLLILLLMRIEINNRFLYWLGRHLFPLYIYQRIPMILFSKIYDGSLVLNHRLLYVLVCFIITIAIAYTYPKFKIGSNTFKRLKLQVTKQ